MMNRFWLLLFLVMPLFVSAKVEVLQFDDPAEEQRYRHLISELRCLVCQNQNLAESDADLAKDLRNKTYEMIKGGAPDDEILDYMVQRYGDFVLYRPPVKSTTVVLWLGPAVFLIIGVGVIVVLVRRQRKRQPAALSAQERQRAQQLLRDK